LVPIGRAALAQVAVFGGACSELNAQGESINAARTSSAIPALGLHRVDNSTFTIQLELSPTLCATRTDLKSACSTAAYLVFPGAATTAGSRRLVPVRRRSGGRHLFDNNAGFRALLLPRRRSQ